MRRGGGTRTDTDGGDADDAPEDVGTFRASLM